MYIPQYAESDIFLLRRKNVLVPLDIKEHRNLADSKLRFSSRGC